MTNNVLRAAGVASPGWKMMPGYRCSSQRLRLDHADGREHSSGHRKAGEALCQVYKERFGGEAHHVDFMRYALPRLSHLVEQSYDLTTTYVPSLYKWLYDLEDSPASLLKRAEGLLAMLSHLYLHVPVPSGTVITDYESHHAWVNAHTQRYFVAHLGMVDELGREGAPDDRICVTGIPVRPVFTRDLDRRELRPRLGSPKTSRQSC